MYVFCRVPASLGRVHRAPSPVFEPSGAGRTGGGSGSAGPMGGERFGAEVDRLYVLQLLRAKSPLLGAWHPIMGHIKPGETAAGCAARELREEVGLDPFGPECGGFWALEQVHPYYVATIDCIVLSPRFAAEVGAGWAPRLNGEHSSHRWVEAGRAREAFMWPGQAAAVQEMHGWLTSSGSLCAEALRIRAEDLSAKPT